MKDKKRKLVLLNYHNYKELGSRLEKSASEGLILERINNTLWTFRKSEPQKLKYAVTFFNEGSVFSPSPTDNQLNYLELAKSCGWDFVCEYDKVQVFSSTEDNPIPFETDPHEALDNIHSCSKKFISCNILVLAVFLLNLGIKIYSMFVNPILFFDDSQDILSTIIISLVSLIFLFDIVDYFNWHYKSRKLVALGEDIPNTYTKKKYFIRIALTWCVFAIVFTVFYDLFNSYGTASIIFPIIYFFLITIIPVFILRLLKRLNISATTSKLIMSISSFLVVIISMYILISSISNSNTNHMTEKRYKEIEITSSNGESNTERIYIDDIPLKYQDLYPIDTSDTIHSCKADIDSSYLLTSKEYTHEIYNLEDNTTLRYEVYNSPYNFVIDLVANEILNRLKGRDLHLNEPLPINISDSRVKSAYTMLDTYTFEHDTTGYHVIISDNTLIVVYLSDFASDDQLTTIVDKLLAK